MLFIHLLDKQTLTEGLLWARYHARHQDTGGQDKLGSHEADHPICRQSPNLDISIQGHPKGKIKTGTPSQVWGGSREGFLRRYIGRPFSVPTVHLHGCSGPQCLWSSLSVQTTDREKEIPFPSKRTRDIGQNRSKAMRTSQLYFEASSLASAVFTTIQGGK